MGRPPTLRYHRYLAGSTTSFSDSADVASLGLAAGQTQTTQVNVGPPSLPAGNPPLDNPVIVNKARKANIGLEHFWQFTSQPVGRGHAPAL